MIRVFALVLLFTFSGCIQPAGPDDGGTDDLVNEVAVSLQGVDRSQCRILAQSYQTLADELPGLVNEISTADRLYDVLATFNDLHDRDEGQLNEFKKVFGDALNRVVKKGDTIFDKQQALINLFQSAASGARKAGV